MVCLIEELLTRERIVVAQVSDTGMFDNGIFCKLSKLPIKKYSMIIY
jgi:hypothetical protein